MYLLEKTTVKRVLKELKDFDELLNITILEDSAKTANDAAKALNCELGAIVKSLLLKSDEGFLLCLVSGDKKCSLNKIKKITQIKNIKMASADEVKKITGFSIGGVSPIGLLNKIKILIDFNLNRFQFVFAAAGHTNTIFKIKYIDLVKLTQGQEKNISE